MVFHLALSQQKVTDTGQVAEYPLVFHIVFVSITVTIIFQKEPHLVRTPRNGLTWSRTGGNLGHRPAYRATQERSGMAVAG